MDARLDRVLAEMEWVRRLAGALARDEIAADDVAQEAWIVATEHAPDDDLPIRPWLARVVHNLVRMRHRGATRREARELAAPPADDHPTPSELLERVEAQRAIADEVIALAEPYREIVLLHYVEGVPTNAIARRLELPPGTVRRRLKVARDQLRERLRKGDRVALVLLLAVARSRVVRATPFVVGALTMKKTFAAIAALIALLWFGRAMIHRHATYVADAARSSSPTTATMASPHMRDGASDLTIVEPITPRHIAGRVVIAGNMPVANAIVRLGTAPFPDDEGELDPIAVARTNSAGRFDFGTRSVVAAVITAEAREHTVAWLQLDGVPAPDRLVLQLGDCTLRVFGVVRDANQTPIANARISTAGLGGFDAAPDGSFSACAHPGWIRVDADGYGGVGFSVTISGRVHHDVVLVPEGIVTGTVADERGRAVVGAHVAAFQIAGAGADRWSVSDPDGRFKIAGLTPALYRVIATAPGMGTRSEADVGVATGAAAPELHLVLVARARLVGRVIDHGTAVAGARISILNRDDTDSYAISKVDGSFVLDGVPLGTVELGAAPYRVTAPHKLVVDRLAMKDVALEVDRVGALHGHVTRGVAAVASAEVSCGNARTFSDPQGAFELAELDGDTCVLTASANGQTSAPTKIAITTEPQQIDIDLAKSSTIGGLVVDPAGAPIADALVLARQPAQPMDQCSASTGSGGEFTCSGLHGGDYEIAVYPGPGTRAFGMHGDQRRDPIHVEPGAGAQITLTVDAQLLAIHGSVVDDTGAPIADAFVEASPSTSPLNASMQLQPNPSARSDASGAFEIERLTTGTYSVRAYAGDGGEVTAPGIAAGDSGVELRIARAGSIAGTLVGFATPPQVEYGGMNGSHVATVDGSSFSVTGIAPGTYWVEAYDLADEREADVATVVVSPGGTAFATLEMRARGTVEATVLDSASRTPVAGLACHVAALTAGNDVGCCGWLLDDPASLSDVGGHVRLEAPAGAVRVFCMPSLRPPFAYDAPYSWSTGDAIVPAGGTGYAQVLAVSRVYPRSDVGFYAANFAQPATIAAIDPSGPAASSGLVVGDAITSIDGASVVMMSGSAVNTLATNHRPGSTLAVGTPRGTFTIVVGGAALQ